MDQKKAPTNTAAVEQMPHVLGGANPSAIYAQESRGQREAVARCPSCRRHYCRECVTEHDHKLLCASCIAALTSSSEVQEQRRWPILPTVQLSASVFVLWVSFYMVGQALLSIPAEFHDFETEFFLGDELSESDGDPVDESEANVAVKTRASAT